MNTFESNILNIYGESGKAWLDDLPRLVSEISAQYGLLELKQLPNLSYNYVLSGTQGKHPIILKIGLDREGLKREGAALEVFHGSGSVQVLAQGDGFLLLERAIPGHSLKSFFPEKEAHSIEITCEVMKKFHLDQNPFRYPFPHIKDWLNNLDTHWDLPLRYLQKARRLRDQLLKSSSKEVLLHGDLHHENILSNGDGWVVIDPKGIIGESAFEVAAFIRNPIPDLLTVDNSKEIISRRIISFAKFLNISEGRILDWCFVEAVLSWVWNIEDNLDTNYFEKLTELFDEI